MAVYAVSITLAEQTSTILKKFFYLINGYNDRYIWVHRFTFPDSVRLNGISINMIFLMR